MDLGTDFYDPVEAAKFPQTILRYRDNVAAKEVGLDTFSASQWIDHFGRFEPLPDNLQRPLALRYHGHQFQSYNPNLGDGRGFLFAQLRDASGRLLDLGTKGSGQTPYSRRGDGRLTLLGGVREVLATRYLEHLGVNTSRSFSLIETGEELQRGDEPSPTRSAVLVRLSHSHIRFGTFQRQAFLNATDNLEALVAYCRKYFYPNTHNVGEFFEAVVTASAKTVAGWMAAGFVHGVMNTDNMNITGESFDYGPYRFLPTLQSGFTAAYFDHQGLYAFGRQPDTMYWNLGQLAQSLSLICEDDVLIRAMELFAPTYRDVLGAHVCRRLGVTASDSQTTTEFVKTTLQYLEKSQAPWPQFWHDWYGGVGQLERARMGPSAEFYAGAEFEAWLKAFSSFEPNQASLVTDKPARLLYEDIGALWQPIAERDDWQAFYDTLDTFTRVEMYPT